MKICLILICTILRLSAFADETRISQIIRSPDLKNFKFQLKNLDHFELLKSQCDIQLKYGMLPSSCFEVIRTEKKIGILKPTSYEETFNWLTENCIEHASETKSLEGINVRSLPAECRKLVDRKIEDQKYRAITMNPAVLFKKRL